jgi:hypothetical protein
MDEDKKQTPPPAGGDEGKDKKTTADVLKEMQEAHAAELAKLRAELENEKTAHAADVKELLLNGKKATNGDDKTAAERIAERFRKKYI